MYVYVCIHIKTYTIDTYIYTPVYVHIHYYIHMHKYIYRHIHVHIRMHKHIRALIHSQTYLPTYIHYKCCICVLPADMTCILTGCSAWLCQSLIHHITSGSSQSLHIPAVRRKLDHARTRAGGFRSIHEKASVYGWDKSTHLRSVPGKQ